MSNDTQVQPDPAAQPVTVTDGPGDLPQVIEYWGTDDIRKWYFPDGVQYFEFKVMAEGERAKFQRLSNQDLTINRDQTAKVRMDPATERHNLIKGSVKGWHLYKDGKPTAFDNGKLEKWLSVADPKLVDDLEFQIRLANPWMQDEMSVEDIRKEIARNEELLKQAIEREAGEDSSSRK